MSPISYCCIICGVAIHGNRDSSQDSWLRQFRIVRTSVSRTLFKIAFSIVQAGEADYVVRLRLISIGEDDKLLGYSAEDRELFFEVRALTGLAVAVGLSPWFGRPKNSPITERLAHSKCIAALKVGFDSYKLVTLAVAKTARPLNQMSKLQELSWRQASLWYSTVLDTDLCLNEASFTSELPSASGYRPLCWILFGGLEGTYLWNLTQVIVSGLRNLNSIEFQYDTDEIVRQMKLSRRRVTESSILRRFPIDGQGREIITALATSVERIDREGVYSFYRHRKLSSLKHLEVELVDLDAISAVVKAEAFSADD
ncbi:MAG: hypothetical protein M1813_001684 [Trichoglossum hirsutum]|nr:MAG: hypothetical protein M1813_001684 [Trichoglossum hirsutum]